MPFIQPCLGFPASIIFPADSFRLGGRGGVAVGEWPSFGSYAPLKFIIQAARAKFPYKIRMVCGHLEVRMLNLLTIGRPYDDSLIIDAGSGICCECDPDKADRREYQVY